VVSRTVYPPVLAGPEEEEEAVGKVGDEPTRTCSLAETVRPRSDVESREEKPSSWSTWVWVGGRRGHDGGGDAMVSVVNLAGSGRLVMRACEKTGEQRAAHLLRPHTQE